MPNAQRFIVSLGTAGRSPSICDPASGQGTARKARGKVLRLPPRAYELQPAPGRGRKLRLGKQWLAYVDDLTIRTGRVIEGTWYTDEEYEKEIRAAAEFREVQTCVCDEVFDEVANLRSLNEPTRAAAARRA